MPLAPRKNGDQALGRPRGGLSSKIHALVEGLGQPARCSLTQGQVHDSVAASALLKGLQPDAVVADKAYDCDALLQGMAAMNATPVIPPRANRLEQRKLDQQQYKHRSLLERFFCRIKHFRRVATRYDKLARRFESFAHLAAAFLLARSYLSCLANFFTNVILVPHCQRMSF